MSVFKKFNFTGFRGVFLKNTAAIRLKLDNGFNGTFSIPADAEADQAWTFPLKSGTFPIMGTFSLQLAAATTAFFSTVVTVSGIRAEDGISIQMMGGKSGSTYGFAQSTGYILTSAVPGNGNITLYFQNLGNATGYVDMVGSYLAVR